MAAIEKRIRNQRRLVERLGAQLAFELLVLDRLEGRALPRGNEVRSMDDLLSNARKRRAAQIAAGFSRDDQDR